MVEEDEVVNDALVKRSHMDILHRNWKCHFLAHFYHFGPCKVDSMKCGYGMTMFND